MWSKPQVRFGNFNPPAPCGAGPYTSTYLTTNKISIHPPRAGRDAFAVPGRHGAPFQSTRPVRGGTKQEPDTGDTLAISIHPPRAGRDYLVLMEVGSILISIHPPRAGRDRCGVHRTRTFWGFQSTRPVRGGTSYGLKS